MLKAVLKKSREGGKGSKKETGMCKRMNWQANMVGVEPQDPTPGWADVSASGTIREEIWVRTNSILERHVVLNFLLRSDFEN